MQCVSPIVTLRKSLRGTWCGGACLGRKVKHLLTATIMGAGISFAGSRVWFSRSTWILTEACCYDGGVSEIMINRQQLARRGRRGSLPTSVIRKVGSERCDAPPFSSTDRGGNFASPPYLLQHQYGAVRGNRYFEYEY